MSEPKPVEKLNAKCKQESSEDKSNLNTYQSLKHNYNAIEKEIA